MGVVSRKRAAMESLCEEVLARILQQLPIPDVLRARAVCRRWRACVDAETAKFGHGRGYCPLVFQRFEEQHTWLGFDSATGQWESLPSLSNVPRDIFLVPIAGSGNGLLGFRVSQRYSEYVVGNPYYSQKWMTLPRSADSWGCAAMFMATSQDGFRVVAVREEDTQIYKSESDKWAKVGDTPRSVQEAGAVARIRDKACAALDDRLYTTDGNLLVAFDLRTEKWIIDRISIPVSKNVMQVVECAGSLFVITEEEDDMGRISVWGRGVHLHQFSLTVEMPAEIRGYLRPAVANARSRGIVKLRAVGHGQTLFFWRHNSLVVVSYDLCTRGWRKLPEIVKPDIVAAGEGPEVTVDVGFFEPKYEIRQRNAATA